MSLKLVKVVENDDGGVETEDSWTLSATAASPNDTRNFSNLGSQGVFESVFSSTGYGLLETVISTHPTQSWS